jgi:hypothetical protein
MKKKQCKDCIHYAMCRWINKGDCSSYKNDFMELFGLLTLLIAMGGVMIGIIIFIVKIFLLK